jgi:hypothetical protein
MPSVVPHRFLFRYSIPVHRVDRLPKKGGKLLDLPKKCDLPDFAELDDAVSFAELRAAWNERGLGFSLTVSGKKHPPSGDRRTPTESDGLQVWIDMRNTQTIHRASRFCRHFCLLPTGGGPKGDQPIGLSVPIARAREEQPLADPKAIAVRVEPLSGGYNLEAWLPAEVLTGYEPQANPLLGFYYCVRDAELGEQFLSVGHEFPFAHDPSLWSTLELTK